MSGRLPELPSEIVSAIIDLLWKDIVVRMDFKTFRGLLFLKRTFKTVLYNCGKRDELMRAQASILSNATMVSIFVFDMKNLLQNPNVLPLQAIAVMAFQMVGNEDLDYDPERQLEAINMSNFLREHKAQVIASTPVVPKPVSIAHQARCDKRQFAAPASEGETQPLLRNPHVVLPLGDDETCHASMSQAPHSLFHRFLVLFAKKGYYISLFLILRSVLTLGEPSTLRNEFVLPWAAIFVAVACLIVDTVVLRSPANVQHLSVWLNLNLWIAVRAACLFTASGETSDADPVTGTSTGSFTFTGNPWAPLVLVLGFGNMLGVFWFQAGASFPKLAKASPEDEARYNAMTRTDKVMLVGIEMLVVGVTLAALAAYYGHL
ncbi:hypothetical protein HKX48_000263 [Thoreauomyces humboldtii]|nr:hypothetical protein HKX48_000263 [Thoreauomyces humboldtii]